ncbi:MAG: M14 family metallopeptidase [Actinomycetota bacterium]
MPEIRFDRFYRYDELTHILHTWEDEHPRLLRVETIGKSYEGRDIWLAAVTNLDTGPPDEKPAFWVDANIHAREVTGCTAALHLINRLLAGHANDPRVTRAVDTRTFYVVPRLNPDGAELALADRPRFIRSSVRPYPLTDEQDGLHEEDVDGDGRILMMRVGDPNGAWKPYAQDPRLMVPRDPDEGPEDGDYYRMLPEGTVRKFDGVMIKVAPKLEGLDLNRNFPMEWATEGEQRGAGPYPASEAEVRAMVQGVTDRPNITGHITYHTFSGVHLRPYSGHEDEHFPTFDLRAYKLIGERATAITGYPAISVFHDFRYEPKETIKGGADDWMYDHIGVFSWTTEFWSPQRQAGISDYKFIEWLQDHPVEDDVKLLRWSDEKLGGRGYVEWYPFDHPQLGKVELGGWDRMFCWSNPPPELLEAEIAPHSELAIYHALVSPRLELESVHVDALGSGVHHIRVVVTNSGWLPTNVTQKALDRGVVRPLEVELTLPEGVRLVSGEKKVEAGQLTGRVDKRNPNWWGTNDSTTDRAKVEWVVAAPSGATIAVEARHQRAGRVGRELELAPEKG